MTNTSNQRPTQITMECHGGCGASFIIPLDNDDARRAGNATFDAHLDVCPAEAARRANMAVVAEYVRGDKGRALPPSTQRRIDAAVWALQDGYGAAGYTPAQGWDWSGIRDSSAPAVERMAKAVRKIVGIR